MAYVAEMNAWLDQRNILVEDVDHVASGSDTASRRSFSTSTRRPAASTFRCAIVADKEPDGRIEELRIYFSSWPLTGRHLNRPPLLQPDPRGARGGRDCRVPARARRPATSTRSWPHSNRTGMSASLRAFSTSTAAGTALRGFYTYMFSNGGGIPMEQCSIIDDGRACAVEYNVVRWGVSEVPPEAAMAVYVRGDEREAGRGPHLRRRRPAAWSTDLGGHRPAALRLRSQLAIGGPGADRLLSPPRSAVSPSTFSAWT